MIPWVIPTNYQEVSAIGDLFDSNDNPVFAVAHPETAFFFEALVNHESLIPTMANPVADFRCRLILAERRPKAIWNRWIDADANTKGARQIETEN